MRILLLSLILIIFHSIGFGRPDSAASDIRLQTYVESNEVPRNREVTYHVELKWNGDLSRYEIEDVTEPVLTNLLMRGSGSANKVTTDSAGNLHSLRRITYYFTPVELGMAYIDGITITYYDERSGREEKLISSRLGVKITEPVPENGASDVLSAVTMIVILGIVTGLGIYFYFRYRRRREQAAREAATAIHESVEEKYLRLLKETIHFKSDHIKESVSDLTHLLHGYFSERYRIQVTNLRTDDLTALLKDQNIPDETLTRVNAFLETADLVRFAGEKINDARYHQLYDTVELILENQKDLFGNEEAR